VVGRMIAECAYLLRNPLRSSRLVYMHCSFHPDSAIRGSTSRTMKSKTTLIHAMSGYGRRRAGDPSLRRMLVNLELARRFVDRRSAV
jgi:hypothetical protein